MKRAMPWLVAALAIIAGRPYWKAGLIAANVGFRPKSAAIPTEEITSAADLPGIGGQTAEYLADLSAESFKRQADLDEAVWRSLPFFAATFAFVATLVARAAVDLPPFEWAWLPGVTYLLLVAAALSMGGVLRWFAAVLRPREYEYPARDAEIRAYAADVSAYYRATGLDQDGADARALIDLRLFMAQQYGDAASTNFVYNADRMKARGKLLQFLLAGFLLAFFCEATIFIAGRIISVTTERKRDDGRFSADGISTVEGGRTEKNRREAAEEAGAAQAAASNGGRAVLGHGIGSAHSEQAVTKPPVQPNRPERPKPPLPQIMMKDRAGELGYDRAPRQPDPKDDTRE